MESVKRLLCCCAHNDRQPKLHTENVESEFLYNKATEKLLPTTRTPTITTAATAVVERKLMLIQIDEVDDAANEIEIEQSLAAAISDRATDEVLEALTRYRRGLGIADSPSALLLDEPQTPDIVRSRSSHDSEGLIIRPGRGVILPKLGLESPTATPHLPSKRRSIARKVRPQSVVENLSLGHIPDLLESPSSHHSSSSQISPHESRVGIDNGGGEGGAAADSSSLAGAERGDDEGCDSITELPSASFQLQHLVKGRPKRAKTRAPTRPLVAEAGAGVAKDIGEGLEQFFRPGSVTPTTLTPLVSPTSEECSSLSFVDSPTMSRDGNGHMTSEETTPILEERKPIKLDRSSPLLRGVAWATRSRSTDNLEKYSPLVGRKSPLIKMRTESGCSASAPGGHDDAERLLRAPLLSSRDDAMRSPSNDSIKSHPGAEGGSSVIVKTANGVLRTPIVLQKPRPWSVVGSEPKSGVSSDFHCSESSKTTPEKLDEDCDVVPFGQSSGGSIVGITPGIALAAGGSGGGSIVGITPGAALEKKSVRELAAGLNRMELPKKPAVLPRSSVTTSGTLTSAASSASTASTSTSSTASTATTTKSTNVLNTTRSKITNSEKVSESLTKKIAAENCGNVAALAAAAAAVADKRNSETNVKRIAGKEISRLFEETLVEGLQRSATRRTSFRDYIEDDDVIDL